MSSIPQENKISTVSVPVGYNLSLQKDKKTKLSFLMFGSGKTNRESKVKTIDLWHEAESMTKAELYAVNIIKDNMVWEKREITNEPFTNGLSYITAAMFDTKSRRTIFQKGVKLLREKKLATKVCRNTYMLHPLALIPTDIEEGLRIWNKHWESE